MDSLGVGARRSGDSTPLRPTVSQPSSRPDWTPVGSAYREGQFLARINSDGYPIAKRDELITAAQRVCAMVSAGNTAFYASKTLRLGYGFSGPQAQAIGAAALDVYCPEAKP